MINILSKETIDKIAAGEVAESPVSVVKELLDNSVDSGADSISVEIKSGGTELIRVTDNGSGIEKDDIRAAFLRHATSKLRTAEDIEHVMTMGFRGEALASIAAVSRTELVTKTNSELTGTFYRIDGGVEKSMSEVGAPDGTTIAVKDFLYNVPVRRQFLKSFKTESAYITSMTECIALAHPEISFSLTVDNKNVLHTPGSGSLRDVIYIIYGKEVAANLIEVCAESGGVKVTGYIAKPVINRSRRDDELFFVNGRYVQADVLKKAAEDSYAPYMMQHRFPVVFLNISLKPESVDVNIHPRKQEVRFSDPGLIYDTLTDAISASIKKKELVVDAGLKEEEQKPSMHGYSFAGPGSTEPAKTFSVSGSDKILNAEPYEVTRKFDYVTDIERIIANDSADSSNKDAAVNDNAEEIASYTDSRNDDRNSENAFLNLDRYGYRLIGQVFDTYWIIEYKDEMYMIDQHAAHEKVNYEEFCSLIESHSLSAQMLYPPIVITLSAKEAVLMDKYLPQFREMGYEMEYAGDRDYIVRSVPANLPEMGEETLLKDLIGSIFEEGRSFSSDILKYRIATMSCKAAVKGGQRLSESEARALIDRLIRLKEPYACPHGRPTLIKWSRIQIEKLFKRIV